MPYFDESIVKLINALRMKPVVEQLVSYSPKWVRGIRERYRVRHRTRLVVEEVLTERYREAIHCLQGQGVEVGDYLEFGVYHGTSLICMHRVLQELGLDQVRLVGFDSFEGLPPVAETDSGGYWRPGAFKSTLDFTTQVLEHEGVDWDRVVLVPGYFAATLNDTTRERHAIQRASVIMVDCDLYQSAREALAFCAPLILDKAVVFFDDWYPLARQGLGEKKAFDEFLEEHAALEATEQSDFEPNGKIFLVSRRCS